MSWTDPSYDGQEPTYTAGKDTPPKPVGQMPLSKAKEFAQQVIAELVSKGEMEGASGLNTLLNTIKAHEDTNGTIAQKHKKLLKVSNMLAETEAKLAEAAMALTNVQELKVNAEKADKKIKAFTKPFLGKHGGDWLLFGYPVTDLSRDSLQRLVIYAFQNKVGFNHLYNVPDDTQHAIPDVEPFKSQPGAHITKEPPF